jgi:hypothetical protein
MLVADACCGSGSHNKCGNGIGEKHEDEPLKDVRYLVILEPDRCPRNKERKRNYEPMRIDPRQHCSRIRHAGKIRGDVNCVCDQQGYNECEQQPPWKSLFEIPSQPLPGHLADARTHNLDRGHERPRQQGGPEKFGSKLRSGNGVSGDPRGVIVCSPGNNSGPERLQGRSNPTSGDRCASDGPWFRNAGRI